MAALFDAITQAATVAAACACAFAAASPWGKITLLGHIDLHIPGVVYRDGAIALTASLLAIALRRFRLAALAAGIGILFAVGDASIEVPREIKTHLLAAQSALFPVNRLLDQANIPDITLGSWNLPKAAYFDDGFGWIGAAAAWLIGAAIAGMPFDPLIGLLWRRYGYTRCQTCGSKTLPASAADYCRACGAWQRAGPEPTRCGGCRGPVGADDRYCAQCGAEQVSAARL